MLGHRFAPASLLTACLLFLSSIGWADLVVTKDGREYEGTIISEDKEELVIRIGEREIALPAKDVTKITYREEPAAKAAKERAVDPDLLEKFYARSLSLTSGARGIGYGSGTAGSGGFSGGFASGSWVIWKGFHGVEKVSEADFFRVAGVITSNVGFWSGGFLGLIRLLKNAVDINTAARVARVYNEKILSELGIDVPLSEIKPQF